MKQTRDTYTGKPFRYDADLPVAVDVDGVKINTVGRMTRNGYMHLDPSRLTPAMFRYLNPDVERPWKQLWIKTGAGQHPKPVWPTVDGPFDPPLGFLYDGCHKVTLVLDQADMDYMRGLNWSEDDVRPLSELPDVWVETCPLRFIGGTGAKNWKDYVEQGEYAEVTWE